MPPDCHIRHATPADVKDIAQLMRAFGFDHSPAEIVRRWRLAGEAGADTALLAHINRRPVGLIACHISPLLFYPAPIARITTLIVDHAMRRQGIGRALIAEVITLAKKAGCDRVELTTHPERTAAPQFYNSLGFRPTADARTRVL